MPAKSGRIRGVAVGEGEGAGVYRGTTVLPICKYMYLFHVFM